MRLREMSTLESPGANRSGFGPVARGCHPPPHRRRLLSLPLLLCLTAALAIMPQAAGAQAEPAAAPAVSVTGAPANASEATARPATGTPASATADLEWLENIPLTGCLKLADDGKACAEPVTMKPARADWAAVQSRLDTRVRIPVPGAAQLAYTSGKLRKKSIRTEDLSSEVPRWLALRFDDPAFGATEDWVRSTGNLLEAFHGTRGNAQKQKELLGRLEKEFPEIWQEVRPFLAEWARDDYLYSDAWKPTEIGNPEPAENDGILERPPFLLPEGGKAGDGSQEQGVNRKVYQACAPIYATLQDLFTAENGFRDYYQQAGSNYLDVYPLKGGAFCGMDAAGLPFLLFDVSFHQKPVALWNLKFTLRQLLHQDGGRWQMENHLLEGDMNYLRLRIFYDPILNAQGNTIGYVKTEWMDIDIKSLPDSDPDRQAGARGDVGNIKRVAEKFVQVR
jgi:hypothetical protein